MLNGSKGNLIVKHEMTIQYLLIYMDIQKRLVHHCNIINPITNTQYNISEVVKEFSVFGLFLSFVCVKRAID